MKNIQIISDVNLKSIRIKSQLIKKLKITKILNNNIIIVVEVTDYWQTLKK